MDRRAFIKAGCLACIGSAAAVTVLQSCRTAKYASGELGKDGLNVDLDRFKAAKGKFHSSLIVTHEELQYPIYVYRASATEYNAVLMRCPHQGAELQANGDILTCPAHNSEFDRAGKVQQGPAAEDLRSFATAITGNTLFIDLRKKA